MNRLDLLLEKAGHTVAELADLSGLAPERVEAIATGRWTPSPEERQAIATALDTTTDEIMWGHTMSPRNVRYHRFGLKEDFSP